MKCNIVMDYLLSIELIDRSPSFFFLLLERTWYLLFLFLACWLLTRRIQSLCGIARRNQRHHFVRVKRSLCCCTVPYYRYCQWTRLQLQYNEQISGRTLLLLMVTQLVSPFLISFLRPSPPAPKAPSHTHNDTFYENSPPNLTTGPSRASKVSCYFPSYFHSNSFLCFFRRNFYIHLFRHRRNEEKGKKEHTIRGLISVYGPTAAVIQ
jgi:hypothetical protein